MAVVYKITRGDGLEYVGITTNLKSRLYSHQKSERFSMGIQRTEVLYESTYENCQDAEPIYISVFDTYKNGLNVTPDGKGNHKESTSFNTYGYKFSEKSKKLMGDRKRGRTQMSIPGVGTYIWCDRNDIDHYISLGYVHGNKNSKCVHSEEYKQRLRIERMGSKGHNAILNEVIVREIIREYTSGTELVGVGVVQRNGKKLSYEQAFCLQKSEKYGVSSAVLRTIVRKKCWKHVWEEFKL